MTPDERAAMAREVLTQLVNEFTDGTIGEPFRLTPAQRARMLGYIDREYAAIPLGAVVEVAGTRWTLGTADDDEEWCTEDGAVTRTHDHDAALSALYHARREAEESRERIAELEEERNALGATADEAERMLAEWAAKCGAAERERDEARRALAAKQDQGLGASAPNSEGQGPMIPTDGPPSPAPSAPRRCRFVEADGTPSELYEWGAKSPAPASAPCGHTNTSPSPDSSHARVSAPRRWWLVVDCEGTPREAFEWDERRIADADAAAYGRTGDPYAPHAVVPVIEARVTRETVERVAAAVNSQTGALDWPTATRCARAVLRALGYTIQEADHA